MNGVSKEASKSASEWNNAMDNRTRLVVGPARMEDLEARVLLSATMEQAPAFLPENSLPYPDSAVWVGDFEPHAIDLAGVAPSQKTDEGVPIISPMLQTIRERIESLRAADPQADLAAASPSKYIARITPQGLVQVYTHVEEVTPALEEALAAAGLQVELSRADMRLVQGWVDYRALDAIAAVPGVLSLSLPTYGMPNTGAYATAGDSILNAESLRAGCDVTGNGVKVGVISNGVVNRQDSMYTGDLPETIMYSAVGSGDEGTAMLEIVHDLAPDADLYFAPAATNAEMVAAIEWLKGQGVHVIVDDMTFYIADSINGAEPYFTDGPSGSVALTAKDAVDDGIVYVTCAGNWQRQFDWYAYSDQKSHWQGQFADTDSDGYHEFYQGDETNALYVLNNQTLRVNLQWSDPWPGSGNNYDLFLYDNSLQKITSSELLQTGTQYPWEKLSWTNTTGSTQYVHLVIKKSSGASRELELFAYATCGSALEYTTGDSLASQQAIEEVITVGAINSDDSGHDTVAAYSSQGPSTIYTNFSTQTSTQRDSLDVCGIDKVETSIGHTEHFPLLFGGTSAAAPHIAGIAALLLEIDPTLTPAEIEDLITGNAVDIGAGGYDAVSGYGRADALATVTAAATAVDLKAASDTGTSSTDDLTNLDNSDSGKELQFDVTGTISGATVTLYKGDDEIGTAVASGTTTTVTTNGAYDLADGQNAVTARQTQTGKLESPSSASLTITVDTAAPTADVADVSPDPRQDSVSYITITFSEAVSGFNLADLALARDGGSNLLTGSQSLSSSDNITWTLTGLSGITGKAGEYELKLTASASDIEDSSGNGLAADASDTWAMNAVNGTSGADTITISWDGTASRAEIQVNQDAAYLLDLTGFPALNINGLGGDDTLTVDFSAGNPIPAAGIIFDGGDDADTLEIVGSTGADTVTLTGGTPAASSYEIGVVNVEAFIAALGAGDDTLNLEDGTFAFAAGDFSLGAGEDVLSVTDAIVTVNDNVGASDSDDSDTVETSGEAELTFNVTQHLKSLQLSDESLVKLQGDGHQAIVTTELKINENQTLAARLDLTDNNLVIDYTGGTSPLAQIQTLIRSGMNVDPVSGTLRWTGNGITSSIAANSDINLGNLLMEVGVRTAVDPGDSYSFAMDTMTSVDGVDVPADSVVVKFTYAGDADLDGIIDAADYAVIDWYATFGVTGAETVGWMTGDFNLDGTLDASDYALIDWAATFQGYPL